MPQDYDLAIKTLGVEAQTRSFWIKLLRLMMLSKESDHREDILVRQGKAGPHVSSRGHEALIAVPMLLENQDALFPYYRGCHLMMGKGLRREEIARDFLYKRTSTSGGRSMSVHAGSRALQLFPTAAPTASQCLPAVGVAWAQRLRGTRNITVCSLGDGATRGGEFYEAVCMAVEYRLPLLFLVEDNGLAISTRTQGMSPFDLGVFDSKRFVEIDGTDVDAVLEVAGPAINRLRDGEGPEVMLCKVERLDGHTSNEDQTVYRSQADLDGMVDPIVRYSQALVRQGVLDDTQLQEMVEAVSAEARRIYREAEADPDPDPETVLEGLYGPPLPSRPVQIPVSDEGATMVEATQRVLRAGLQAFPELFLFGQDIEDPKGGVFGFTRGLSDAFPGRVLNAPIAEASIVGSAVGLATQGLRPVFEIQFIDFMSPGFNQLVNQVASLRWRSQSRWTCPMVIYAPYGGYITQGGLWHSQSNEGWWTHMPGLRVAIPSTPEDLVGLFWSAFQDEDPSLVLIPKRVFRVRHTVARYEPVPFGRARVVQPGEDLTLVVWGNGVDVARRAVALLSRPETSVEILDLRTLVPCDWAAVTRSVSRTGRLVVVQEDSRTASFGASVIAEMTGAVERFEALFSPPILVSRPDSHIPCHPDLEAAVLPGPEQVACAIEDCLAYSD